MSRVAGILGGMGPLATADFYRRLVEATPAATDQDHVPVVIDADPRVPDRTMALRGQGEDPTPWLVRGAVRLVSAGASVIAVPCNTAHAFLPAVRARVSVPILDMIAETAGRAVERQASARRAGFLATRGTIESRLYHDAFARYGIDVLVPDDTMQRRSVDTAIALVKSGQDFDLANKLLRDVARTLHRVGADLLVAGCTEIPIVLRAEHVELPMLDSTQILVEALLREVGAIPATVSV